MGVMGELVGGLAGGATDGAPLAAGAAVVLVAGDGEDVSVDVSAGVGVALAPGLCGAAAEVVAPLAAGEDDLHEGEPVGRDPVPRVDLVPLVCEALGAGAPGWLPPPGAPGTEFELLGKIAVDPSIATYVPTATMNMTTAIAASGRIRPCARERCRPGAWAGANRSKASRNQSATW